MNIEGLIGKAKGLGLSYLRVADGDHEIVIELPATAPSREAIAPTVESEVAVKQVTSQLVGYFRPVAQAGDKVGTGAVVGVIESLGLQNDILAPIAGTITEMPVSDGDAVEYGTVLARIQI